MTSRMSRSRRALEEIWEQEERKEEARRLRERQEAARLADAALVRDQDGREVTPMPAEIFAVCKRCGLPKEKCKGHGQVGWPEKHLPW